MPNYPTSDMTDRFQRWGEILLIEPWWKNPAITLGLVLLALALLFVVYHQMIEKPRSRRRRENADGSGWSPFDSEQT